MVDENPPADNKILLNYWNTKEWKDKSAKYLSGKSCARCGSTQDLLVHHTHETRYIRKFLSRSIISRIIDDEFPPEIETFIEFKCGYCGSVFYTTPQTKFESYISPGDIELGRIPFCTIKIAGKTKAIVLTLDNKQVEKKDVPI